MNPALMTFLHNIFHLSTLKLSALLDIRQSCWRSVTKAYLQGWWNPHGTNGLCHQMRPALVHSLAFQWAWNSTRSEFSTTTLECITSLSPTSNSWSPLISDIMYSLDTSSFLVGSIVATRQKCTWMECAVCPLKEQMIYYFLVAGPAPGTQKVPRLSFACLWALCQIGESYKLDFPLFSKDNRGTLILENWACSSFVTFGSLMRIMSSTWSAASLNACIHFAASSGLLAPNCHTDLTSPFHNTKLLVTEEKSRVLSSSYSKILQGIVVAYSDNPLKATKPLSWNQCLESKAPPPKAAYPQFVTIVIWVVDYERE